MAGALSGLLGALPAAAMLSMTGALANLSDAIHLPFWLALLLQVSTMGIVGSVYGRVFNRAATDWRGSWLFGISYGFLVWMLGPVMIVQWSIGRPIAIGSAAMGLFAAHVLWGLALGLLFPWLHSTIQHHSRGGPFGLE
jgi:hypothetical protein